MNYAAIDALVLRHIYDIKIYDSWEAAMMDNTYEFKGYPYTIPDEDGEYMILYDVGPSHRRFSPSGDTLQAHEVLNRLEVLHYPVTYEDASDKWVRTTITHSRKGWNVAIEAGSFSRKVRRKSFALAVCLCALKALGVDVAEFEEVG